MTPIDEARQAYRNGYRAALEQAAQIAEDYWSAGNGAKAGQQIAAAIRALKLAPREGEK